MKCTRSSSKPAHGFALIPAALFCAALALGAVSISGCAQGDAPADETNNTSEPDADSQPDAGDQPDVDEQPDSGKSPAPKSPTLAPSSGGARLETPNHQIRLIVGPRGSAATLDTSEHRIRMGAGGAQHGQGQ